MLDFLFVQYLFNGESEFEVYHYRLQQTLVRAFFKNGVGSCPALTAIRYDRDADLLFPRPALEKS